MRIVLGFSIMTLMACAPGIKMGSPAAGLESLPHSSKPELPTESVSPEVERPAEVNPSVPESQSTEIPDEFDSKPAPPVVTPSKPAPVLSLPGLIVPPEAREIVETGRLIPTIYYSPIFDEDAKSCEDSALVPMKDMNGRKFMDVCPKTHAGCGFQGSCIIKKSKIQVTFNVIDRKDGEDRFALVGSRCKFGYGVHDKKNRRSFCLQPYMTIAADLSVYNPGDVIFIPKVRGLALPSGKKHDGYFVVADAGRLIKGKGRFDFFSGHQHWSDFQNPLAKLKLHDKDSNLEYHRIVGSPADQFKNSVKDLIAY